MRTNDFLQLRHAAGSPNLRYGPAGTKPPPAPGSEDPLAIEGARVARDADRIVVAGHSYRYDTNAARVEQARRYGHLRPGAARRRPRQGAATASTGIPPTKATLHV